MALEFRGIIITALILGLFIFAMFSGGVFLALENNANVTLINDASLNRMYSNLSYDLNNSQNIAQGMRAAFETDNPLISAVLLFKSIISGGIQMTSMVVKMMGYMFLSIVESFGGFGVIVISVISAILLIILALSVWRVYQAGS